MNDTFAKGLVLAFTLFAVAFSLCYLVVATPIFAIFAAVESTRKLWAKGLPIIGKMWAKRSLKS